MNLTIRARLYLMSIVGVVALLLTIGFSLYNEYSLQMDARMTKTRHLVEVATSTAAAYAAKAEAGELTPDAAKAGAISAIKAMRYDGSEYFWINDLNPTMVMHPMKPALDGTDLSKNADPNGKLLFVEMVKTVKASGGGFVDYMWPKPGADQPLPKLSYVKLFKPWGWVIGSGIYVDDVMAAVLAHALSLGGIVILALALMLGVTFLVTRSINQGISDLLHAFDTMAKFDFTRRLNLQRKDEIGQASRQLNGVMDSMSRAIHEVMQSSENMAAAAEEMASSTVAMKQVSAAQRSDIEQISKAANDAASVVHDINSRVSSTRDKLSGITTATAEVNKTMHNLQGMATKVSEVSGVINDISEQINLLALNAAIEAARAGDAGRGFAVVADEVRKLAANTANSVNEIGEVMVQLQDNVRQTSSQLEDVAGSIAGINGDVGQMAMAMQQQAATMSQISASVDEFSHRVGQLNSSMDETNTAAASVAHETTKLSSEMGRFKVN